MLRLSPVRILKQRNAARKEGADDAIIDHAIPPWQKQVAFLNLESSTNRIHKEHK